MVAFQATPETAETLVDPFQGITSITGDWPSFGAGPDPLPPRVVPAIKSVTQYNVSAPGGTSVVLTPPVGWVQGDTLLASFAITGTSSNVITAPTGLTAPWGTLRRISTSTGTVVQLHQWIKTAWSDDPSSHTFTFTGTQIMRVTLIVIEGPNTISAPGTFQLINNSLLTQHTIPVPLTSATLGPALSVVAAVGSAGQWSQSSSGYTEQADFGSSPNHGLYTRTRAAGTAAHNATFTTSTSNRSLLGGVLVYPAAYHEIGYSGWLKLILTESMEARFNTYGSPMQDTEIYIFEDPLPEYPSEDNALYHNDGTEEEPYFSDPDDWGWSSINADGSTIVLPPGTYWIMINPWEGPDWDTSDGNAILTLERIDGVPEGAIGVPPRVIVGDLGDIGGDVVFRPGMTSLKTAVGGNPSLGYMTIRDRGQDPMSFVTGSRVTVDFGEGTDPIYSGYLIRASRRFWHPVDHPMTQHRQWRLHLVDINILWGRRVVYNKADPADPTGPKYLTNTADIDALAELFANWLDLDGDDLDLETMVSPVGNINDGQVVYPWNAGMTMGEAVRNIAQLPAAVWGINPRRQVVYADVDEENAPTLSDRPANGQLGYREIEIIPDGSQLANDVMVWGAGRGSAQMVFKRLVDDASAALHGLWQDAVTSYAVWKQATANKIASSIVNGSPQSKRGRKNDRLEVRLTTHETGLVVGDRPRFINHDWDYSEVIPVRSMEISFPVPYQPRYDIILSHEIDRWGFEDPLPPIVIPPVGPIPIDFPIDIEIGLDDACLVAPGAGDAFDRTISSIAGPWTTGGNSWGGGWLNDPDYFEGALTFPGDDYDYGAGDHRHGLSPLFTTLNSNPKVTIVIEEMDPNGGAAIEQIALGGQGGFPAVIPVGTLPQTFILNAQNTGFGLPYVEGRNSTSDYNSLLTGTGTYAYLPGAFGSADSAIAVSLDIASITVKNGDYFAAKLPYAGSAAWNQDVVTGSFLVSFDTVATSGVPQTATLRYGPVEVTLTPSTDTGGGIDAVTDADSDSYAYTGWLAATEYLVEVALNLPDDEVIVRVYEDGALVTALTVATSGERVADGSYQPIVRVRAQNTGGSNWTFRLRDFANVAYYDTNEVIVEDFEGGEPTADGWGNGWVVYSSNTDPTSDPGLEWLALGGYGSVEMVDEDNAQFGFIEKTLPSGAHEVRFSISDYLNGFGNDTLLRVFFGKTGTGSSKVNYAYIGNEPSLSIGTGSGNLKAGPVLTMFDGQPINVILRWANPTMELFLWPVGDPEPTEPTVTHTRVTSTANLPVTFGIEPQHNANGDRLTLGPIDNSPSAAMVIMTTPGNFPPWAIRATSPSTDDDYGRSKSWPFSDPMDGRSYPVTWGSDSYVAGTVGSPSYSAWAVWATDIGGTDYGPGYPLEVVQHVASLSIPPYLIDGVPTEFEVIVRGTLRIGFGLGSGGSAAEYTAVIKSFNYGVVAGPTPPSVSDYFIDGGAGEGTFLATLDASGSGQRTVDQPFALRFTHEDSNGGLTTDDDGIVHLQWGVEILDATDNLIAAGPFLGGEPHWINIIATVLNVTYEIVPAVTLIAGNGPCPPLVFDQTPVSPGTSVGQPATSVSTTVFYTQASYVPKSLRVFVNGKILRWGIDFTETNPLEGVFTLTTPVDPDVDEVVPHYDTDLTS